MAQNERNADRKKFLFDPFRAINETFEKLPKIYYIQQIRDAVASTPIPNMPRRIRRKIVNSTQNKLRTKYSNVTTNYMADVEKQYLETIKGFNVRRFLKTIEHGLENADDERNSFKFKQAGRTDHHKKFLRYRKQLKENLFISYPFIRFIVHSSYQSFPRVLNDYGNYKKTKSGICIWLMLIEFEGAAQRDLENKSIFLREEWYPKIVQIMLKHYRKRSFPPHQWPKMLNCAKGLINRQITEVKTRTFEHIFDLLKKRKNMPPIKFYATCSNGRIELHPSFRELRNTFHRIFKNIAAIATKFPPLELLIDRTAFITNETYLKVEIGEIAFNQLLNRLEVTLEHAYAPILNYVKTLEDEYYDLFSEETRFDLDEFLSESRHIDSYFEKIAFFRQFIEKLQKTVQNKIFDIAIVNQGKALIGLRTIAQDYINEIIDKIADDHKNDCQRICDWFANVQRRALEAPKSTETLLANGEFMLQMKNKKIAEIREHIQKNLQTSGRLIDLREFDEEHFNLQIETIHWLHKIQDIFEQNSSQFEIYKNQFEEHLNTVTKKLTQNIDDLIPKLAIIDDMYDTNKLHNYYATLEEYTEQIKCFEDYIKWINKEEKLFKLPVSQYPIVESLKNFLTPFAALIKLCIEWLRYYYIWMDGPFEYLDRMTIENLVQSYTREFEATQKYYRNRIKADMLGNPVLKFRGQTEDPDPEKHPVPLRLCSKMIEWINGFQIGVSIVQIMCNPALRDRHWVEMSEIAGFDLTPDAGTSLRKITKFGIDHLLPSFEIISIGANKELKLQMDLADMFKEWETIEFPITVYNDTNITILGNIEDIQVLLDDHIIQTLAMRGSAFVKPCERSVRNWYEKLLRVSHIFDEWLKVQTNWLYLLPILSSKDILVEMPNEERLFSRVNEIYCKYIEMAIKEPIVMKMTEAEHLLEDLKSANEMLDEIKSGVNAFLERKRLYFPRFFFLSNHEMLQILSETKNSQNIQPFLCKCFNGINQLQMDESGNIDAMLSSVNESVNFVNRIVISETGGSVEKWLLSVENEMYLAVRNEIINSYADYVTSERIEWSLNWAQMIVLVVASIFWSSDVHTSLLQQNRDLLSNVHSELNTNLDETVEAIRSSGITNLNRMTLKSLCIQDIHARDVTQKLIANANSDIDDFEWIAQLRYYWIDKEVTMKLLNATISYGYEYLGNFQRVVMTPLTERCYRTVLLAYQHQLNASIEGPTATGKSETIKDLSKALATQLKIFDCTPDLDFRSISRFLKGISMSGAWICFEDFNRIELKTISVISQQIRTIQMAMRKQQANCKFMLDGVELKLNTQCNVCIMSNPLDISRTKMPNNLKTLFRPVSMMQPDVTQITEVSLFANGYKNAKILAKKITKLYKICSKILPSEVHYDFGLRSLKIALRISANRILAQPDEIEENLIYQSLLDVNLPKINPKDVPLFKSIVSDLFPKAISRESNTYDWLREAYERKCSDNNYQPVEALYRKLIETYEMSVFRQGVMLLGNPHTGKSFVLKTLIDAIKLKHQLDNNNMDIEFVNPRAIDLKHLFGEFDPINMEWQDGVVSSIFRRFADNKADDLFKWIIFDGPIYSEWIENLNTVLDDNRKLCLSSGEVLNLTDNTLVLFEVGNLNLASPSTVVNYVIEYGTNLFDPLKYNLINTTFDIIQMVIDDAIEINQDDYQKFLITWIQAAVVFAFTWGIGGILNEESRTKFDQFHKRIWSDHEEYAPPTSIKNRIDVSIPSEGYLNDYYYVFKQKGTWKLWADLVRRQEPEINQYGVQVATVDTARYSHLVEMHMKYGKNVLLIGPSATGKTYMMQNMLRSKVDSKKFTPGFVTFNKRTKASDVHEELLSKLIKLKRGVYGPPKGMTCAVFIDDLNVPIDEHIGSHSSIELLRQIFDYGYVFDLKSTSKIFLSNTLILAACGVGGRCQEVNSRFLIHFNCFSVNESTEETHVRIANGILMNGYKKGGHAADVIGSVNQIVAATMHVYAAIVEKLKPTPSKPHYRFDMRDILRVCSGCSLLRKESVENKKMFAKIWFHESLRVFHDRLIESGEKDWIFSILADQINDTCGTFKDSMEIIFESYTNGNGIVSIESIKKLSFGSYLDVESYISVRKYEEITNFDKLTAVANTALNEYKENDKTELNVILFTYALEHLNRICRIISMPGGSGLIIGNIDSGRRSLIRLASMICKQKLFQLNTIEDYGIKAWREDIKSALKSAGGMGQQTCLYLSESQLKHDAFLIDVEYLLNSGNVPNLWPIDEKQELLEMVRLVAQGGNRNIDISADEVFTFFVNRCRQNLHIVLSFNSVGPKLRNYIRLYPTLVNCCTIDFFDKWPEEALEMIASKFLSNLDLSMEIIETITIACKYIHTTAQGAVNSYREETGNCFYVSSASYLELMRCFAQLYIKKQTEITTAKSRYESGLNTLQMAAKAVENMQTELSELEPKLRAMALDCKQMTTEIELKTIEASVATEQVKRDELVANEQAAAAESMEDECSKDLAQAVPVLEDALQALNTLKPADITLVKSMKNPPSAVKLVMAAVCVMKGVAPDRINDAASGKKIVDYWGPSKRILGDMGFLQSLKDYDKDDISPDIMKKIRKDFIPHKDFQPHIVAKASSAAEGLCKWIKAIENFESVNTVVLPKKFKLMNAKENLKETRKFLAEKRALAAELEEKVTGLNAELERTNLEKERTEREVAMCEQKLQRAEALIGSLGQEKSRWTERAALLQKFLDHLPGDVLISCGIIAYLGVLPKHYRENSIRKWHEFCVSIDIPCSEKFNLTSCLGKRAQIQDWHMFGLAADEFSVENGILMANSCRQCLFLDPQQQANKWIKQMESGKHLKVVKQSDPSYFNVLLDCMRDGHPILIEDVVESLNICLEPIFNYRISKCIENTIRLNSRTTIKIASGFRLYLTSIAKTLKFMSDYSGKLNIINFIFASNGLEENLLDILVLKENPYLREERDDLLHNKLRDKAKIIEHENAILSVIAESESDILEDETAIKKMDASKQLYLEVIQKQSIYIEAEHKIETFRESYRQVASYAANLYCCLDQLRFINPMYEFSLDWYLMLYNTSIEKANRSRDQQLLITNGKLKEDQLNFFVNGDNGFVGPLAEKPEHHEWITEKIWCDLHKLGEVIERNNLLELFEAHIVEWKAYYYGDDDKPPSNLVDGFSSFEKLLISKIFHPELITQAMTDFIATEMGAQFVSPPIFDIHKSFEESNILTPLIFILSPGVDPIDTLWMFAERLGYSQSMQMISLGTAQGDHTEAALNKAQKQGSWICLQNCHLNTDWLTKLEIMWKNINFYNTTPSFRLWMTSEPTTTFPLNLIQNSVKMTYENPKGLKNSLLNSYQTKLLNSKFYDSCPKQDKLFKQMLYSLTFFDAIVNERKHYGSVGWNVAYEFGISDFTQSAKQLQMFLGDGKFIPFKTLHYIISECIYGGLIVDEYDKRLLKTLLNDVFNGRILEGPPYKISSLDVYTLPLRYEHRFVVKFIEETIPVKSNCRVYGLHENSDFIFKLKTSNALLTKMKIANDIKTTSTLDEVEFLVNLTDIIAKLPHPIDCNKPNSFEFSYERSLNIVLTSELKMFNKLLKIIRKTCTELQQALQGHLTLTPELECILESLMIDEIPHEWRKISYASEKGVASYLIDFCKRLTWIQNWWLSGDMLKSYWLSAFFRPSSFLTAIKLDFARKYSVPLEEITIDYTVVNNDRSLDGSNEGYSIYSFYLESAHWNGSFIEEQMTNKSIEPFPMIHLKPIQIKEFSAGNRYECPVYYHLKRGISTNGALITRIWLPVQEGTSLAHWIKRGVALGLHNGF
ncbi:dynein heavy chain 12, axonemal [Contarinia nasturtii]|uniref:dynein heavy chain 12, axonemal n=1 Tax=Contarinia nasturtii TaxID=265458 RepID=UPI0012D44CB9|nr:dynein heavy chain 12, axonemal [Contarinia nasturtii]